MDKPFFSIVIPTLNEEKYIGRLLTDLVKQSKQNFEVVVVDGHSQDRTREVVQEFKYQFPLQITQCTKNVGAQRNIGAKLTAGKYLLFFDADIQIAPTFLEKVKKILERDNIDFCSFRAIPDNCHFIDHLVTFWANIIIWLSLFWRKPLMGGFNLLIKKSVFVKIGGFDESIVHAEDQNLTYRALKAGYRGKFYFRPSFKLSFRRFEREGRLSVYLKYAYSTFYTLFKGPIRNELFEYKMGGKVE